ncbi:uncharacterized protein SPSK_03742 [Sporothrix schenckii 1099-18]|uniref:Uncharacterized protein n=1 Tax=Sporothrix schenckii 1099-18 TaxID=1397361 RepID=A0A0F2M0S0_SPOSC|nr:uncharacterized protein SPSK_03742 [Sporothrix schenckii 1099-18]KJR82355.1 hypothetical protein SPSK_03742 [Sporothrix schenckii 1099-18]
MLGARWDSEPNQLAAIRMSWRDGRWGASEEKKKDSSWKVAATFRARRAQRRVGWASTHTRTVGGGRQERGTRDVDEDVDVEGAGVDSDNVRGRVGKWEWNMRAGADGG